MNSSSKSRILFATFAVALFALAGALVHYIRVSQDTVEVNTAPVTYEDLTSTVPANGKVEPVEVFQAHALIPGIIENLYVHEGQNIPAGTLLLRMNDSDEQARLAANTAYLRSQQSMQQDMQRGGSLDELNGMKTDLHRAQLQQQQAAKDLATKQGLLQTGAASPAEVADARQRLDFAQATIDNLQQRMTHRFSPAELARAQAQLADGEATLAAGQKALQASDIRTPIAGTVYSLSVAQYDFVPGGADLMNVANLNKIRVRTYFDEPDIGKLSVGQPVKITWNAKPNQTWHGHVAEVPTSVKAYGARNVGVCIITVDDARGDLLPNTDVTVLVTAMQRFHVLSVPHEAVHTEGPRTYVYTIQNGKLVETPVRVGAIVNFTREQIDAGLGENQRVVLNAVSNRDLNAGLKVRAVE